MKQTIRMAKIALPCALLLLTLFLTDCYVLDIAGSVLLAFPLSFVLGGALAARARWDLPLMLALLSLIFIVFVNLRFNIGTGVLCVLLYSLLGALAFGIKRVLCHALLKKRERDVKKR